MTRRFKFTIFGRTTYILVEFRLVISSGWTRDTTRTPGFKTPEYNP